MPDSDMSLLDEILASFPPGTEIPKPEAKAPFRIKGEGVRRGERALIYTIPNHSDPSRPHEKGVTASELESAYEQLLAARRLTRTWFNDYLYECAAEGSCNFTTIGGLFELLGDAEYRGRATYRSRVSQR